MSDIIFKINAKKVRPSISKKNIICLKNIEYKRKQILNLEKCKICRLRLQEENLMHYYKIPESTFQDFLSKLSEHEKNYINNNNNKSILLSFNFCFCLNIQPYVDFKIKLDTIIKHFDECIYKKTKTYLKNKCINHINNLDNHLDFIGTQPEIFYERNEAGNIQLNKDNIFSYEKLMKTRDTLFRQLI